MGGCERHLAFLCRRIEYQEPYGIACMTDHVDF